MNDIDFEIGAELVLGPLLAAFCVLTAVRAARRHPGWTGGHALVRLAAAFYTAAVLSLTIFPVAITYGRYANQTPWYEMVNFIPLLTVDLSFVPNVVMLVPLGFLIPLMSAPSSLKRIAGLAFLASLAIETAQLLSYLLFNNGRSVDVNDLIANTLGGVLGYLAFRLAARVPSLDALLRRLTLPAPAPAGSREEPAVL
ncbi:VanZ family protein [Actinocorallia aurantiaca]|uniref:VanZ-like domain-containing protein n=1 Tax=Actinocorallia aurantiaca TaxID=46204 RepID=A0ABN3U4E3_9ACTN